MSRIHEKAGRYLMTLLTISIAPISVQRYDSMVSNGMLACSKWGNKKYKTASSAFVFEGQSS